MSIQLSLSRQQATELLTDLEKAKRLLEDELDRINGNIEAVKGFLSPIKLVGTVRSMTYPYQKMYTVTEQDGVLSCTCDAFRFKRVDVFGHCKHIRTLR